MKKLLIGLLALGSISAFASRSCNIACYEEEGSSVLLHVVKAVQSSTNSSNSRKVYARTCIISNENGDQFFKNKVQGIEVTGVNYYHHMYKIDRDENKKADKFEKQNKKVAEKLLECES